MHRFYLLIGITWLHLTHAQQDCPIKTLSPSCQCQATAIICTNANLNTLPEADMVPRQFTTLELDGNNLGALGHVAYAHLKVLRLLRSGITSISPGAFSNLTQLTELNLADNQISNITKPMLSGLGKLQKLDLHSNRLASITPHALCPMSMPDVMDLNLEYNQLTTVTGDVIMFKKLTSLNLGYNLLTEVPTTVWTKSQQLETIKLQGNPLGMLKENSFQGLKQLKKVNADSCQLSSVHDATFTGVTTIFLLYLGNNRLTGFNASIVKPFRDSLQVLHLQNNSLTYIEYFEAKNMRFFQADNNPWHCDCRVQWMKNLSGGRLVCATPAETAGLTIGNATASLSCPCVGEGCKPSRQVLALAIGIPILVICALLIAFFLWRIAKSRREEDKRKSVRYSAVYRDTVEQNKAARA